jgi:hypothetical protein
MAQQLPLAVPLTCDGSWDSHIFHAREAVAAGAAAPADSPGPGPLASIFFTAAKRSGVAFSCNPSSKHPYSRGFAIDFDRDKRQAKRVIAAFYC